LESDARCHHASEFHLVNCQFQYRGYQVCYCCVRYDIRIYIGVLLKLIITGVIRIYTGVFLEYEARIIML